MNNNEKIRFVASKQILWIFPTAASVLMLILSRFNPLGFHTIVELTTIVISFLVFALGWSTYSSSRNTFLIFLACGYFWVGSFDLMHAFAFPGINIFMEGNGNLSIQFWIAARYLEAFLLLMSPLVISRKQNKYLLFIVFGIVSIALTAFILSDKFPIVFVEGQGLTRFKIYSEYLIVFVLAMATVFFLRQRRELEAEEIAMVLLAIVFTMLSEFSFTLYDTLRATTFGVAGHLLKIYSFWFIFQAIIITNLQKPYARIKQAEERLSFHLRNTPLGCISWDTNFICTEWNQSAEKIFGFSADETLGKHPINTILLPEARKEIGDIFNLLLQQKGGSQNTNKNLTKDGKVIICNWYNTPITDETGEVIGIASLVQDITEQKEMEKNLRQSQKMEAVGQLTGGIAHDFNNMLGVIIGNLELLLRNIESNSKAKKYIDYAFEGVERGTKITKKLLSFSRKKSDEPQITNVNDFISGMEHLLSKSLTPKITIETDLSKNIWMTKIDPGDFEDTLLNMAINSRDAMPNGGSLIIETSNKVLDEAYVRLNPNSSAGEYIQISISDTGNGMTSEVCDQIFVPFFTTKEMGKGTGLGMSMVYGFIQRSGGHIKVYSEVGKGTSFHLFLPKAKEDANSPELVNKTSQEELPRGNETILVVDDEEALLKVAVSYLESLGYKILTASDSKQALEELRKDNHIDLLFSDVIMPGHMDGFVLGIEVLKKHKNIKVLLTSGFTGKHQEATNGDIPLMEKLSRNLLNKPYNLSELAYAVRQTLDDKEK